MFHPRLSPYLLIAGALLLSACGPATTPVAPTLSRPRQRRQVRNRQPRPPRNRRPHLQPRRSRRPPQARQPRPPDRGADHRPAAAAKPTTAPAPTAAQAGQPKRGGILKVGLQADPTSLDPQKTSLTALFHVTEHIYSLLVQLNP